MEYVAKTNRGDIDITVRDLSALERELNGPEKHLYYVDGFSTLRQNLHLIRPRDPEASPNLKIWTVDGKDFELEFAGDAAAATELANVTRPFIQLGKWLIHRQAFTWIEDIPVESTPDPETSPEVEEPVPEEHPTAAE